MRLARASEATAVTGPLPTRQAYHALAILAVTWVIAYLDRQIVALLIPSLKHDLVLSDVQASLLQGVAFAAFFTLAGIPIGRLVDSQNRRNIIVFGVVCWSVMTVACGFARNFGSLFAGRMFVGIGEACLAPAAVSIIADYFPPERRGRAIGTMLMGGAIGTAMSSLLGGAAMAWFAAGGTGVFAGLAPWRLTFIAVGVPGLVVAFLLLTMREPLRQIGDTIPAKSAIGLRAALKGRWRTLVPLYTAFGGNMIASFGVGAWMPTLLMRDFSMSPARVGVVLGTVMLGAGLVAPVLGGWASDVAARHAPERGRLHLVLGMFMVQLGVAAAMLLLRGFEETLGVFAVSSLAASCIAASALVVLQDSAPALVRGRVIVIYLVIANVAGMGLGPLLVALLTDHVFADEKMVRFSVVAVIACTAAMGGIATKVAIPGHDASRPSTA